MGKGFSGRRGRWGTHSKAPAVGLEMLGTFLPFMPFLLVPVAPLCRWPLPQKQARMTNSAEQDAPCHPGHHGQGGAKVTLWVPAPTVGLLGRGGRSLGPGAASGGDLVWAPHVPPPPIPPLAGVTARLQGPSGEDIEKYVRRTLRTPGVLQLWLQSPGESVFDPVNGSKLDIQRPHLLCSAPCSGEQAHGSVSM